MIYLEESSEKQQTTYSLFYFLDLKQRIQQLHVSLGFYQSSHASTHLPPLSSLFRLEFGDGGLGHFIYWFTLPKPGLASSTEHTPTRLPYLLPESLH